VPYGDRRSLDVELKFWQTRGTDPIFNLLDARSPNADVSQRAGALRRLRHCCGRDRVKTPSLRGLAARPPYFHNGIAATLKDVVLHYEVALGFVLTANEEADLVAFLEAL